MTPPAVIVAGHAAICVDARWGNPEIKPVCNSLYCTRLAATQHSPRKHRALSALPCEFGSKRGYRFPQWQRDLVLDRGGRARFEAVLARLAVVGPWSRYRFFMQGAPALEGRTPIQALQDGAGEAVLHAAETWAQGEQGGG